MRLWHIAKDNHAQKSVYFAIFFHIFCLFLAASLVAGGLGTFRIGYTIPGSFCGDGTCDINESCATCSSDCGICPSTGETSAPSGGSSYGLGQMRSRSNAPPAAQTLAEKNVPVLNVYGDNLIQMGQDYVVHVTPTLNFPPTITVRDGLNSVLIQKTNMQENAWEGYIFKISSTLLHNNGQYTSYISAVENGVLQQLVHNWRVALSADRLFLTKVSEIYPDIRCRIVVSNEGEFGEDFEVSYWITAEPEGLFPTGLQSTRFTKFLLPSNVSSETCKISEIICEHCPNKPCGRIEDEIAFKIPPPETYPISYWCKAETQHSGIKSQAYDQLTVTVPAPSKPPLPPPKKKTWRDVLFEGGRLILPESPWIGILILYLIVTLIDLEILSWVKHAYAWAYHGYRNWHKRVKRHLQRGKK